MVFSNDRSALRLFGSEHEREDDPFLSISTSEAVTGMPILKQSLMWFDCKLEGHLSPEADCRLYLGKIVAAHISDSHSSSMLTYPALRAPTPERRNPSRSRRKMSQSTAAQVGKPYKQ
jgi:flavin reductase (DIM6/NTAB) family NADH-FMN oxidoreductase RutF